MNPVTIIIKIIHMKKYLIDPKKLISIANEYELDLDDQPIIYRGLDEDKTHHVFECFSKSSMDGFIEMDWHSIILKEFGLDPASSIAKGNA